MQPEKESMESEPGNTQAFNRYSFVCGSPIAFQDECGYVSISGIWDGFVSAVSTVINTISTIGSKIGGAIAKAYDDGQFLAGYCFGKAMENLLISVKNFSEGNISSGLKHFGLFITWGTGGLISSILGVVLSTIALPFAVLSGLEEGVLCSIVNMDVVDADNGDKRSHKWPKWVKRLHKIYEIAFYFSVILCITMVIVIICLPGGFVALGLLSIFLKIAIGSFLVAFYTGTRIFGDGGGPFGIGGDKKQMRVGRYHFKGGNKETVHRDETDPGIFPIGTIKHPLEVE